MHLNHPRLNRVGRVIETVLALMLGVWHARVAMRDTNDMTLHINTNAMDTLKCHAQDASPNECCGILVGTCNDKTSKLASIIPAENVATTDRRISYQIDWKTLFNTIRSVRSTSRQVLGFYHSHPDGSTEPSRRDRETAWIGYIYVILPVVRGVCGNATAWCVEYENAHFERVTLTIAREHA